MTTLFRANWALLLGIILTMAFFVWIAALAPCSWLGWMTIAEVPSRCLEHARGRQP